MKGHGCAAAVMVVISIAGEEVGFMMSYAVMKMDWWLTSMSVDLGSWGYCELSKASGGGEWYGNCEWVLELQR